MCLISGGNWNNTSNAGVWALNLNNNRTNSNDNVGLRAADYDATSRPAVWVQWSHRDVSSCLAAAMRQPKQNRQYDPLFGSYGEDQGVVLP
ncbi:MAG: hypothetical protein EOM24_25150 [Chloroflexia bacterium]|nr:hypothetical protein [Chloroflexia bacterium]